jgi:Glucosyl transferase GtrII
MIALLNTPLESVLSSRWRRIDPACKAAFIVAMCVSLLAFGFEMTNLTLHHDDLVHLMVQKPLVGYYLGRFAHSWLFFYGLDGQFAPFLHMTVGMLLMSTYGVLVAHFWGARKALDLSLVAAIVCVFPYMAHVYQYNSVMVAYPLAHLLVALAVVLAVGGRALSVALAALLFFLAFSIYQAVLANAVTIFLIWVLTQAVLPTEPRARPMRAVIGAAGATLVAVAAGGILHVLVVSSLHIQFDAAQGADQAFSLRSRLENGLQLSYAAAEVLRGSRAFFVWPEAYLPQPVKMLQGLLLAAAAVGCLLLPRGAPAKLAALVLLGLVMISPRVMQFLHPRGTFHDLTVTAYALVIGAAAMIAMRLGGSLSRNAAALVATLLTAGYVMQCNWISTVNHLNTQAHFTTTAQILARLRALPDQDWDGKTIAVVGRYDLPSSFPFVPSTGVASEFMTPTHMSLMSRLLRDEANFVKADPSMPKVMEFAAARQPWPSPQSIGIIDGVGVVVLSKEP